MARIVTVYSSHLRKLQLVDMSFIRWVKISAGLARLGHRVDMATPEWRWLIRSDPLVVEENLRRVPLAGIRWRDYDVVKTLFHRGFETLLKAGGQPHPFIISKLGSVVGPNDAAGIYFYGRRRRGLYATQEAIHRTSRLVTLLTPQAKELWETCFGAQGRVLLVPGGVDAQIPPPGRDPYEDRKTRRCLFAGNIYTRTVQPEANRVLCEKLNRLGALLAPRGIRLYLLGRGDVGRLDKRSVRYLGVCPYEQSWDYLHFADVGIVLAAGGFMHNNESSKIYHYLRAGLPVVAESGFPNENLVFESGLGFVVENGDLELMARRIDEAVERSWDRDFAVQYILREHTWEKRVGLYDRILRQHFG